jgi:hypothetical protein
VGFARSWWRGKSRVTPCQGTAREVAQVVEQHIVIEEEEGAEEEGQDHGG